MIRPLPHRPGTARQFRFLLIAFAVRHLVSIAFFVYLIYMSWRTGTTFFYVMTLIATVFLAFMSFQGTKIWRQYQRASQRELSASAAAVPAARPKKRN